MSDYTRQNTRRHLYTIVTQLPVRRNQQSSVKNKPNSPKQ